MFQASWSLPCVWSNREERRTGSAPVYTVKTFVVQHLRRADGTHYLSPWIFHRRGKPIRKFAVAFDRARIAAASRTRPSTTSGVPPSATSSGPASHQHVAMQMTGHRSPEVF